MQEADIPLVTIGALHYNNSDFVIQFLESVSAQSYPNIELILIDDASTDNSVTKIEEWLKSYSREHRLLLRSKNCGIHAGYEDIIRLSRGDFISIVATDDLLDSSKIADQIEAFSKLDDDYGIVYGDYREIDQDGKCLLESRFENNRSRDPQWTIPQGDLLNSFATGFQFLVQSAMFRAKLLKNPLFKFKVKYVAEDLDFTMQICSKSLAHGIDKVAVAHRQRPYSISSTIRANNHYHLWSHDRCHILVDQAEATEGRFQPHLLSEKLHNELLTYAYHPEAIYLTSLKTWNRSRAYLKIYALIHSFLYIHRFHLAKVLKKLRSR